MQLLRHVDKDNCAIGNFQGQRPGVNVPVKQVAEHRVGIVHPRQRKMWCLGQMDAAYIARMEHILDLYTESRSPEVPLVNVNGARKQLVGKVNAGRHADYDGGATLAWKPACARITTVAGLGSVISRWARENPSQVRATVSAWRLD